jgi:DNA-directed RNA polymerase subunit RPC12/RpoP
MAANVAERPTTMIMQRMRAARALRCPRCAGNLFLSGENSHAEWNCLQCGRSYPARIGATSWAPEAQEEQEVVQA